MPKFQVTIERTAHQVATIEVESDDEYDAESKAMNQVQKQDFKEYDTSDEITSIEELEDVSQGLKGDPHH